MKLSSYFVSRPVCFFVILSLLVLLVPGLPAFFWSRAVTRIETQLQINFPNIPPEIYSEIAKDIKFASMLLILMIIVIVLFIFAFMFLLIRAKGREIYLRSALIKQMEATQQAERKSMNKTLAFARASHDMRGSLAGIGGLIEICREEVHPTSGVGTNLMLMEESTRDALGIMTSILDTSKIEAGKMLLEEEEFDLQHFLENVVDLHYSVGMKKGVDVILDVYDDSLTKNSYVKGDRGKLKQILDNLINNAVKFTSEGHVIVRVCAKKPSLEKEILVFNSNTFMRWISCLFFQNERTSSDLEITSTVQSDPNCMEFVFEVSDTGKGIPKEKQKYVFENYVQVKETAIGQEGTGLGLGIVQSLVRLMGGEIEIVDKAAGEKGTCFKFNTYFTMCYSNVREDDLESARGNYTLSNSYQRSGSRIHSPKLEGSHIVLFIQNNERRKMVKRFMVRLGIKVSIVKEYGRLSSTLRRVKQKSIPSFNSSSGRSDVNSKSDSSMPTSRNSSNKSKEIPLSAMDGTDNIAPVMRRANARGTLSFILIVTDTSVASFVEISRIVADFRRDYHDISSRVVWIDKPGTRGIHVQDLDEPTDLIISKPLHGSRLYELVRLLPEFGGVMHPIPRKVQEKLPSDPSTSASAAQMKFKLRSSPAEKFPRAAQENDGLGRPLSGKKILVVEDNSTQQMVAKVIFSQLGAEIDLCETGANALKLVSKGLSDRQESGASSTQPYDYILMDCKMEEMDGFETTRRIREEEENYGVHIPIIALTAHTQEEVIELIKQAGMDYYLSKPLRRQQLLEAIEVLNRRFK